MAGRFVHSPFIDRCLSPVTVFRDGQMNRFPCGKCAACQILRANDWAFRLSDEIDAHPYNLWFTLTYSNDYLPLLKFVPNKDFCSIGKWISDHDDNVRFDSVKPVLRSDHIEVLSSSHDFVPTNFSKGSDYFAYLSKRDIQLFLKVLRKKLYLKYGKSISIRYFIAGEYGPSTYRPHSHGLLFTDDFGVCQYVRQILYSCWQMCDKDLFENYVRYSSGDVSQYVTTYVNSVTSLPAVYADRQICPFHLQSKNPSIGYSSFSFEGLREQVFAGNIFYDKRIYDIAKSYRFRYPSRFLSRYFPKCFQYRKKSYDQLLFTYGLLFRLFAKGETQHIFIPDRLSSRPKIESLSVTESYKYLGSVLHPSDWKAARTCFKYCSEYLVPPSEYLFLLDRAYYLYDMSVLRTWYEWQVQMSETGRLDQIFSSYTNLFALFQSYASETYESQMVLEYFLSNFKLSYSRDYDYLLSLFGKPCGYDDYVAECNHVLSTLDKSKKLNSKLYHSNSNLI